MPDDVREPESETHIPLFRTRDPRAMRTACGLKLPDPNVLLWRPPTCPACLRAYLKALADAGQATKSERAKLGKLEHAARQGAA
jgi:hypothetical protein